jgi:ribosomal-protein-alanine N-acetyltransferase
MMNILQTNRLFIRQFTLADAPFILELMNSPGWLQYVGTPVINTLTDARSYLTNGPIKAYNTYDFRLYLVELKANATPIGMCGLIKRDSLDYMDIGYALLPQYEGQGYAYEMVSAAIQFAFNSLHRLQLAAITHPGNLRSLQLLKKLGFIYKKTVILGDEMALYIIDAKSFSQRHHNI